jgi:hypothetical protein
VSQSYYETGGYELKCVERGCIALTEFLKEHSCEIYFERSNDPEKDRIGRCRLVDRDQATLTLARTLFGLILKLGEYGKEAEKSGDWTSKL